MDIPKKIINEVAAKMLDNKIIFEDIAIVPNVFLIYLHKEDYLEIRFLLKTLRDQVIVRLKKEIAKTEKNNSDKTGRIKSLVNFLTGYELLGSNHKIVVPNDWSISFEPTEKDILVGDKVFEITKGEICVVANYTEQNSESVKLDSRLKTQVTIFRTKDNKSESFSIDTAKPKIENPFKTNIESKSSVSNYQPNVLAILKCHYNDDNTEQVYEMTKDKITVGRESTCDFILLKASERISRKHLEINYKNSKFFLKSFGIYGTLLQGNQVPLSEKVVDNTTQKLNKEVEIPNNARISLAGGEILIDFTKQVKQ